MLLKRLCCIFYFLVVINYANGQDSTIIKRQIKAYQYLKDSCSNYISMGCGYVGVSSPHKELIHILVYEKRYDLINQLLYSSTPIIQYLSTEVILRANRKHY